MADFTSVPTVELLTRAADAAGRAAAQANGEIIPTSTWQRFCDAIGANFRRRATARLIAASGPDHWRAVEALMRALRVGHLDQRHRCRLGDLACDSVAAARLLAEQVLRDLGGTL